MKSADGASGISKDNDTPLQLHLQAGYVLLLPLILYRVFYKEYLRGYRPALLDLYCGLPVPVYRHTLDHYHPNETGRRGGVSQHDNRVHFSADRVARFHVEKDQPA